MPSYNVHSHIFTMSNAPERFLHLYLPGFVADAVDKITNTQLGAAIFEKILARFGGNGGKRYASFLAIGKSKNQLEVFEQLMAQYDDPDLKFIGLTIYMEQCGAGRSLSGFEGQLEEILEVKRRYPDRLLIFMGIDPRWKQSGTELRDTVQAYFEQKLSINATASVYPFAGLKLYPSTGFYPFDEKLKETLEWAADNEVPVLSHCYYRGGIYHNDEKYLRANLNPCNPYTAAPPPKRDYIGGRQWLKWLFGRNSAENNKNTCSYFLEPYAYEDLLAYFEKREQPLKLCLAHFGGAEQMLISNRLRKPKTNELHPFGVEKKNWYDQIKQLMQKSPRCTYTDVAYTVFNQNVHPVIFNDLRDIRYGNKIMFGTDYFLTEQEQPEKITYHQFRDAAISQPSGASGGNMWQQVAQDNTAAFLKSRYYQP